MPRLASSTARTPLACVPALAVTLGVTFTGVAPLAAQADGPGFPDRAELDAALAAHDVPGAAMATLSSCAPREVVAAGTADLSTGTPVTVDTVFEAASLTKPVFAYLTMKLVAVGEIDLDRPFARTFAYDRILDADRYAQLTPRLVLTHRSGLPNWVDPATDFHDRTAPIPFTSDPGTTFSYSGEAFQLLQAFVAHETGQTFESLFRTHLSDLMPNSAVARPAPGGVPAARGYPAAPEPGNGRGLTNLYARAMAASSLVTTAGDYAAFLGHVCAGGGLPADLHAEMLRPVSPAPMEEMRIGDGPIPPPAAWGLGWMILDLGPVALVGHGGSNDEFNAFAGYMPQTGDGIVVLTNGRNGEVMIQSLLMPQDP